MDELKTVPDGWESKVDNIDGDKLKTVPDYPKNLVRF